MLKDDLFNGTAKSDNKGMDKQTNKLPNKGQHLHYLVGGDS